MSNSFKLCPTHFSNGAKKNLVWALSPLLRAWLKLISSHFWKCCEKNISVTVCEKVVPQLNKHDDVIEWKFMKIAPPRNKSWLCPCRDTHRNYLKLSSRLSLEWISILLRSFWIRYSRLTWFHVGLCCYV